LLADSQLAYTFVAALMGLLLGSFLNVCIYRLPRDLSLVTPRSFCPECGTRIAWHDNVPVLSYTLLRGRCRHCGKPIGLRYPLVELMTAALFAWTAAEYGWSLAMLKWAVFELLLTILFWTDLVERILPDELTLGGTLVGLIFASFVAVPGVAGYLLLRGANTTWQSLLNAITGAIFLAVPMWLIGNAYARLRRREGIGLGDVKLLLLLGAFLGLEKGLIALMFGAVSGSVIGLAYIWIARKSASTYELPLGTFLCAGAALLPLISKT
jgi:leader peptidase (prepilin peptidase) / N-methyltransferase